MFDRSIFDCKWNSTYSDVFLPLQDMDFDRWWFHGQKYCPPPKDTDGGVKELPANGKVDIAMAGSKSRVNNAYKWVEGGDFLTSQTNPDYEFKKQAWYFCQKDCVLPETPDATPGPNGGFHGYSPRQPRKIDWTYTEKDANNTEPGTTVDNGWTGHELGNLHAFQRKAVAGCALGIAYKSEAADVTQKDFVIFSVVHDCPRNSLEWFPIPNLPACPKNKCICSWFWIHKSTSGTTQMYMTAFQCIVTNVQSDATDIDYAFALPPRRCYNPTDCFFGPRLPMYWRNNEPEGKNNMPESGSRAPTYSIIYGFREGAQHDIFVNTNPRPRIINIPPEQQCGPGQRSRLNQNEALKSGEELTSPDCNITLTFETNGRLRIVEKKDGSEEEELWSTRSLSNGPYSLTISDTGELRIKDSTGKQRWGGRTLYSGEEWFPASAGIVGGSGYHLDMTNYGHLVLYDGTGIDLWESPYNKKFPIYFWPTEPDPPVWENMGRPRAPTPPTPAPQPTAKPAPTPQPQLTMWNFEIGNLDGWSITGKAFIYQPTYGDNSAKRRKPAYPEGNFYVGTYERPGTTQGDKPVGTMTSGEFTVSKSSISFLIGGGNDINNVYVGLKVNDTVVLKSTGEDDEAMQRKNWDVSAYLDQKAQIVIVDMSADGWGHINVDDIKFFDEEETTWNFETGDLRGWSITGTAFIFQPISGDNSANRGSPADPEGNCYVGTYERPGSIQGDKPVGTMTSGEFTVSKSSISFRIGGGNDINNVYVGLKVNDTVVKKSTGEDDEEMQPTYWDVSAYLDQKAQIVVVDISDGDWGHINVDDFRFYDESEFTEVEERTEGGLLTGKMSKLKSKVMQRSRGQHQHSLVE